MRSDGSRALNDSTISAIDPFNGQWHAYVDGKTYGPYTGHQIREMASAGELLDSDLVCGNGDSSWVQAKDDPVLRLLFFRTEITKPSRAKPEARRGHRINAVAGIIVLLLLGWFAWPYYALQELSVALRDGDVAALESRINWDSVRQGLRADLNVMLLKSAAKEQNEMGKGLAVLLGPAFINQMVDGYVTPQAIGSIIRDGKPNLMQPTAGLQTSSGAATAASATATNNPVTPHSASAPREITLKQIKYAFFDRGPFSFRVDIKPDGGTQAGLVTAILAWSGDWKVTRLILPLDDLQGINERPSKVEENAANFASAPQSNETISSQSTSKAADHSATWGSMFQSQVERCWKKPYSGAETVKPEAAFTLRLNRDGTLQGNPVPEKPPATGFGRAYQESALRAIIGCQPYSLPSAYFDEWKYFSPVFTENR